MPSTPEKSLLTCQFHIDVEPRQADNHTINLLSGWFLPSHPEVQLVLNVASLATFVVPADIPRLDINRHFPEHERSMTSGFSFPIPYGILKHIGAHKISLGVLQSTTGPSCKTTCRQTIWEWNNGVATENEDSKLHALVRYINEHTTLININRLNNRRTTLKTLSNMKYDQTKTEPNPALSATPRKQNTTKPSLSLIYAIDHSTSYVHLKRHLHWLLEQRDCLASSVELYCLIISPLHASSQEHDELTAFVEQELQNLIPYYITPQTDPGLIELLTDRWNLTTDNSTINDATIHNANPTNANPTNANTANALFFYSHAEIILNYTNLSDLIADFISLKLDSVLMPTLYGEGGIKHQFESSLAELHDSTCVNGDNRPALFPLSTAIPCWITKLSQLSAISSTEPIHAEPRVFNIFSALPQLKRTLYADLRQPVLFAESETKRECVYAMKDKKDMEKVFRNYVSFKEKPLSTTSPVYFLTSPRWASSHLDHGRGFQELSLYRSLAKQASEVVLINCDTNAAKEQSEHLTVQFDDLIANRQELTRGITRGVIVATHWTHINAAHTLAYITKSPVVYFLQDLGDVEARLKAPERVEQATWSYRGSYLPLFNSRYLASLRDSDCDSIEEAIHTEAVVNTDVFFCLTTPKTIGLLIEIDASHVLDGYCMEHVQKVIEQVRASSPSARIVISLEAALGKDYSQLRSLADELFINPSLSHKSDLYRAAKTTLVCKTYDGFDNSFYEVGSCGSVPFLFGQSLHQLLQDAHIPYHPVTDKPEETAQAVSDIINSEEHSRKAMETVRKILPTANELNVPKDFSTRVNHLWELMAKRLYIQRSTNRLTYSVIVPVYNALDATSHCLETLQKYLPEDAEAIIVNDCSDIGTTTWLRLFCNNRPRFRLIERSVNGGFIQACITGVDAVEPNRDVVLLNSDVMLTKNSLQFLQDAAYCRFNVALASSLSTHSPNLQININTGDTLESAAQNIARASICKNPTIVTCEGQLLFIRRYALEKFGFFDEVFGRGYCEESDMCMRMFLNGLDMVVADNSLILHRHAASFGTAEKAKLISENRRIFDARWERYYHQTFGEFISRDVLREVREGYRSQAIQIPSPQKSLSPAMITSSFVDDLCNVPCPTRAKELLGNAQVVFILPSVVLGGGTLSVLQHADLLLERGIEARVLSLSQTDVTNRPFFSPATVASADEIMKFKWTNQIVVATFWTTAYLVKALVTKYPNLKGYYYIQDYEPWFYSHPDQFHTVRQAEKTYEFGLNGVVKTNYLRNVVQEKHGVDVTLIRPGIDLTVFYPGEQQLWHGRPRLVAMYRPETARRGAKEMLSVFRLLNERLPEVKITVFGSRQHQPELEGIAEQLGIISPRQVAQLYRNSDLLIDLSYWHGFGRMGLESMACGIVPILSESGGVERYARDNQNCLLADGMDISAITDKIIILAKNKRHRLALRDSAIATAQQFSEETSVNDWLEIWETRNHLHSNDAATPSLKIGNGAI